MERLQFSGPRALQAMLNAQPTTAGKVLFAWHLAAGPALGRSGTASWSDSGTLTVRARDAVWLREIRHARPVIAERLAELLGPDVVRRIVVIE